jgi:hypothetical protein
MAVRISHRSPPEVIQEELLQGAATQNISVGDHSRDVVMDKVPTQTVEVTQHRCGRHHEIDGAVSTLGLLRLFPDCGQPTFHLWAGPCSEGHISTFAHLILLVAETKETFTVSIFVMKMGGITAQLKIS